MSVKKKEVLLFGITLISLICINLISSTNSYAYNSIERMVDNETNYNNISNTYNYYNLTGNTTQFDQVGDTISIKESWLNTFWARILNVVSLVGNWTADKPNYYIKSEVDSNLSLYYLNSNPNNYINTSSMSTYNSTYDNYKYNVSRNWTLDTYNTWNTDWSSTYNLTYNSFIVNVSKNYTEETYNLWNDIWSSTYNSTYDNYALNVSRNWTLDTYNNWDLKWSSTYNATYNSFIYNVSLNYSEIIFNLWNSTWDNNWLTSLLSANDTAINTTFNIEQLYNLSASRIANYSIYNMQLGANVSYLTTYNSTYHNYITNVSKNYTEETYNLWNTIWSTTYNATYHNYASNVSKNYTEETFNLWNNDWSSTFNTTYDSFTYNVSLNYSEIVFNLWNSTWDNNYITSLLSANDTSINTTLNIQELYNSTIPEWFSIYLNDGTNASYLTTYNATYHSFITNVSTNWTSLTHTTYNSTWDNNWLTAMLSANDTLINSSLLTSLSSLNDSLFNNGAWNYSDGKIYPNNISAKVGIGTTAPQQKLEVAGAIVINSTTLGGTSYIKFQNASTDIGLLGSRYSIDGTNTRELGLYTYGNNNFSIWTNNLQRLSVLGNGNVGIGTTSPNYGRLQVNQAGDTVAGGIAIVNTGTSTGRLWVDGIAQFRLDGASTGNANIILNGIGTGNVGIGTTNPTEKVQINNGNLKFDTSATGLTWRLSGSADDAFIKWTSANSLNISTYSTNITFSPGNTEKMRITNDGNVGIGTTSPQQKLTINGDTFTQVAVNGTGTAQAGQIKIFNDVGNWTGIGTFGSTFATASAQNNSFIQTAIANQDLMFGYGTFTERMRIDMSTGNVGIGTSTPFTKLDIYNGDLRINTPSNTGRGIIIGNHSTPTSSNSGEEGLQLYYSPSTNNLSLTNVHWGSSFNPIVFKAKTFNFETGSGAAIPAMYIDASQKVGIGTTTPRAILEVNGDIITDRPGVTNQYLNLSGGSANGIYITGVSREGNKKDLYINNLNDGTGDPLGTNNIYFRTGSIGTESSRMAILEGGNVGIGTTSPTHKLNVVGSVNLTGNLTYNSYYGGVFYNNRTGTSINFASDGVFYPLFFVNATYLNGFSFSGGFGIGSNLTAQQEGLYQVTYMASGDGQNNHQYYTSIFIEGVNQNSCENHHKMTVGGDVITQSGNCFIRLVQGNNVSLRTADIGGTGTGNYYSANLNLVRIGN